jgi:hypothetical protein
VSLTVFYAHKKESWIPSSMPFLDAGTLRSISVPNFQRWCQLSRCHQLQFECCFSDILQSTAQPGRHDRSSSRPVFTIVWTGGLVGKRGLIVRRGSTGACFSDFTRRLRGSFALLAGNQLLSFVTDRSIVPMWSSTTNDPRWAGCVEKFSCCAA